jgi:hypothetical protein
MEAVVLALQSVQDDVYGGALGSINAMTRNLALPILLIALI